MTSYQRARRIYILRGSFITLGMCTAWMLASALGGSITN